MSLSEEMKTKIVLSVQNTSKIISDSNRDAVAQCKKELVDVEAGLADRVKWVRQ